MKSSRIQSQEYYSGQRYGSLPTYNSGLVTLLPPVTLVLGRQPDFLFKSCICSKKKKTKNQCALGMGCGCDLYRAKAILDCAV